MSSGQRGALERSEARRGYRRANRQIYVADRFARDVTEGVDGTPIKAGVIKAVTLHKNVALLNISGAGMIGTLGVAARAFTALAKAGINIVMISQGSSEANISMVIEERQVEKAEDALRSEFPRDLVKEISHDHDVCALAVVGAGMAGTPGVAARVFKAMGAAKINVVMISQGSSQHNISFVVSSKDAEKAVQELHREFGLGGET